MKLGIVGYGKIAKAHKAVFEELGAKIVASCNRSEVGRTNAEADGILNTYGSLQAMIETENLDGIICSPSVFNNYTVAKELIPFQIPILLEKPPGTSVGELNQLVALQQQYKTPIMLATNRIWYSVLRNAVEDIGGLENIQGVNIIWSENPAKLKERQFTDAQIHTRTFSNSIHGLSILHYLAGALNDFSVTGFESEGFFKRDMALQGISDTGVLVSFTSSWSNILPWQFNFYGNGKLYEFKPLEKCQRTDLKSKEVIAIMGEEYDINFKPGFYLQAQNFLEGLKKGDFPREAQLASAIDIFKYAEALTNLFSINAR